MEASGTLEQFQGLVRWKGFKDSKSRFPEKGLMLAGRLWREFRVFRAGGKKVSRAERSPVLLSQV